MEKEKDDCDNQNVAKKGVMAWGVVDPLPNYQNGDKNPKPQWMSTEVA